MGAVGAPVTPILPNPPLHVPTLAQLDSSEHHIIQCGLYPTKSSFPALSWDKPMSSILNLASEAQNVTQAQNMWSPSLN